MNATFPMKRYVSGWRVDCQLCPVVAVGRTGSAALTSYLTHYASEHDTPKEPPHDSSSPRPAEGHAGHVELEREGEQPDAQAAP